MSPPERIGDLAAVFLARLWHAQPEGAPMHADPVLAEAKRHHAEVCRSYNPDAGDDQVAAFWDLLGPAGREGYLRTAQQQLAEEAAR